mmetsp:Transcript_20967/g.83583  ORF Transcript_20967/g.83583 Transcript_20967/m.83583 type:complete len:350 (-) Transcript_20967:625-1674(-)
MMARTSSDGSGSRNRPFGWSGRTTRTRNVCRARIARRSRSSKARPTALRTPVVKLLLSPVAKSSSAAADALCAASLMPRSRSRSRVSTLRRRSVSFGGARSSVVTKSVAPGCAPGGATTAMGGAAPSGASTQNVSPGCTPGGTTTTVGGGPPPGTAASVPNGSFAPEASSSVAATKLVTKNCCSMYTKRSAAEMASHHASRIDRSGGSTPSDQRPTERQTRTQSADHPAARRWRASSSSIPPSVVASVSASAAYGKSTGASRAASRAARIAPRLERWWFQRSMKWIATSRAARPSRRTETSCHGMRGVRPRSIIACAGGLADVVDDDGVVAVVSGAAPVVPVVEDAARG